MTKIVMLEAFDQAIKATVSQIEETKRTELILEGKRQAFQESYDWIKASYPDDVEAGTEAPAEEAKGEVEDPTPVKEKKSK